ncbi:MAG TPA: response regulator [Kofleriaceae bacterium]|nr:response regulator [Kofleriaceae bacterium]
MLEALKFRHRVLLLVALPALALTTVTGTALILGRRGVEEISGIETRYVPLLELNRDLVSTFTRIARALEDAAAAAEESGLGEADALRDRFVAALTAGHAHIADNGGDPPLLRREFLAYYALARDLARQLIAGQTGEQLLDKAQAMHAAKERFAAELDVNTTPDRARVAAAFDSARAAHAEALEVDLVVAAVAFGLMLLLSWWIVRGAVSSLRAVSSGVERLARGNFSQEIEIAARDEFGDLAREANRTALRLREYRELADQDDWLKTGSAGLAGEIAGELSAADLGRRALTYLARYTGATAGAAHAADAGGALHLLDTLDPSARPDASPAPADQAPGDDIAGRAALGGEIVVARDPPGDVTGLRSRSGAVVPALIVAAPLRFEDRCMGVIELGFSEEPPRSTLELLRRTRTALGIAFQVAESRQRVQDLVGEMQKQAEELRRAYGALQEQNEVLVESEQELQAQQEELRTANEELERQAVALEAQRSSLVAKNQEISAAHEVIAQKASEVARASKYKSEFLANMSHELRTPLNSIMVLARILADNEDSRLSAKQVEFAQVIHRSGDELLTLINDILDLAKIEAGKQELVYGAVAAREVASYMRQMFEPQAGQKGLGFVVELSEGLPPELRIDRMRLEQILKNLISNAIKFTEQGRIELRVYRPPADDPLPGAGPDEDAIAFAVTDTGVGIPLDKQQIVFEAFAQADGGTSRRFGGTGLGLAIARQLAARMGGDLRLNSQPGVGSTFTLRVPAREPRRRPSPASTAPQPTTHPAPERSAVTDDRDELAPGDVCFLVIEDDPDDAASLADLIRQAGFRVIVAASGHQGLALATRFRPSGIILDVGLPDVDGWSVMERLQADHVTRDIPVHFITGVLDAERARDLGAVGFLRKPADPEQIRSALRTLERSAGGPIRVLLAESDRTIREALHGLLFADGAVVEAVGSGPEALAHLEAGNHDALVVDLALPDKESGVALLDRLRERPHRASLQIIVYTGLPLSAAEMDELSRGREGIVILDGERSTERVLEEARLFLHRIRVDMPERRRHQFELVHNREAVLEGKRILIVDDDMRNLYSLTNALQAKRLHIIAAADGQEALDQLEQHADTDMVLMDIMMPRMDGHEAIRRIRQHPQFNRMPIIALTARTMPGERQKCLDAGATDFIPKPVDIDRLLSLLRVWLSPY